MAMCPAEKAVQGMSPEFSGALTSSLGMTRRVSNHCCQTQGVNSQPWGLY